MIKTSEDNKMTLVRKRPEFFPSIFSGLMDDLMNYEKLDNDYKKFVPAVNVTESETNFKIDFSVPGFTKEDFSLEVDKGVLMVSGEHKEEKKEEGENFTRREFRSGSFSRSFNLPEGINEDAIDANYKDGILKITIPKAKAEEKKLKSIAVS